VAQPQLQKPTNINQHLLGAYASSALATMIIRYVAGVTQPTFGHAALALIAVFGFLAAFLLIARADVEPGAKATNVIGAAVVSVICFAIVSEFL
jgi:hypothetical protein